MREKFHFNDKVMVTGGYLADQKGEIRGSFPCLFPPWKTDWLVGANTLQGYTNAWVKEKDIVLLEEFIKHPNPTRKRRRRFRLHLFMEYEEEE